jgi:hypothetical protein
VNRTAGTTERVARFKEVIGLPSFSNQLVNRRQLYDAGWPAFCQGLESGRRFGYEMKLVLPIDPTGLVWRDPGWWA